MSSSAGFEMFFIVGDVPVNRDSMCSRTGRSFIVVSAFFAVSLTAGAACPPPFSGAGDGTFYFATPATSACGLDWVDGMHVAAINLPQWAGSAHCGEYLRVTGPDGSTVVQVVDQCPECLSGDIDLSLEAFAVIADPQQGRVAVQWERVEAPVAGDLQFLTQGSSEFYVAMQVRNHRYGVQAMAVRRGGVYEPMQRADYNYFVYSQGPVDVPFRFRITAITGEVVEQAFDGLNNDVPMAGSVQFAACSDRLFGDGFESAALPPD